MLIFVVALASAATRARAQAPWTLHVLGPPASSAERRVAAVLEGPLGCVAARDVRFAAIEPGASVEPIEGEPEACAQWLVVRAESGNALVTLEATSGDARARAQIASPSHSRLATRAQRRADRVSVTIEGGGARAVTAYTAEGSTPLARAGDAWEAALPGGDPVLVVAQGDDTFGAAILPGLRAPASAARAGARATVLLAPVREAVIAGGAPRVTAVVGTFDVDGRPTRAMSLSVTSERGLLRSLEWVATGLAEIRLGAPIGVTSVDLNVTTPSTEPRRLIVDARAAGVPMRAELGVEPPTPRGTGRLVARAWDESGAAIAGERLRVRCADGDTRAVDTNGGATCPAGPAASTAVLLVSVSDDAALVPLASAQLPPAPPTIERARAIPAVARTAPRASTPLSAPPLREHLWTLGARVIGGIDTWGRLSTGLGARVGLVLLDRLRLEGGVSYALVGVGAPQSGLAATRLDGVAHTVEAPIGVAVVLVPGAYGVGARASIAPAWVKDAGNVGALTADSSAWRLIGSVTAGPRVTTGDVELGLDIGVRACLPLTDGAWAEPTLRLVAEVTGALAL